MPRVAITMRMVKSPQGEWRDAIAQDWTRYLLAQDIQPVLVPNDPERGAAMLEGLDGLILTGGDDIVLQHPDDASDDPLARRDMTEVRLVREAMKRKLPILGVCRGMQLLQWYFGGALEKGGKAKGHVGAEHAMTCTGSLKQLLAPTLQVNSFHENLIAKSATSLTVCAMDEEKLIEGFEDPAHKLLGVMWHPERAFSDPKTAKAHAQFVRNFLHQFA